MLNERKTKIFKSYSFYNTMRVKAVEEKAIKLVQKYLTKKGIKSKRVSRCGYDIKTSTKKIEIKSRSKSYTRILILNYSNIKAFNKEKNIELWAVTGVNTKHPILIKLDRPTVRKRKVEHMTWRVDLHNKDYDNCINL